MAAQLEHDREICGVLVVPIPGALVTDEDKCSLFEEVAKGVAFTLYTIELKLARGGVIKVETILSANQP